MFGVGGASTSVSSGGLFGGGGFGGMNGDAGGFDSAGGFGGAGYAGIPRNYGSEPAPGPQASQGLSGFLGDAGSGAGASRDRSEQSLMPLTIRMLLDAHERTVGGGSDAQPIVNGKELTMFTLVALVESVQIQTTFRCYHLNDTTGRIVAKLFMNDGTDADDSSTIRAGEYVRIFATLRCWGTELNVSTQHVARLDSPNEIAFHFIEVAHVHLDLTGKIQKKSPPPANNMLAPAVASATGLGMQQQGQPPFGAAPSKGGNCFHCGQPGHWSKECPNRGGSASQQQRQLPASPQQQQRQPTYGGATAMAQPPLHHTTSPYGAPQQQQQQQQPQNQYYGGAPPPTGGGPTAQQASNPYGAPLPQAMAQQQQNFGGFGGAPGSAAANPYGGPSANPYGGCGFGGTTAMATGQYS